MKLYRPRSQSRRRAYLLNEALVYISVVVVLLGVGFAAMYRCVDSAVALRRGAEDITAAIHAGERWRADVRSATVKIEPEIVAGAQVLHLAGSGTDCYYFFTENAVLRRAGPGPWVTLLKNVRASVMGPDPRQSVRAWRWELELQVRSRNSRIRPLFTFIAVPEQPTSR